jgi:hypothetical protein
MAIIRALMNFMRGLMIRLRPHTVFVKTGKAAISDNKKGMMQFAQAFPDAEIVASLMRQLSWTHFLQLLPLKSEPARYFYARQCMAERWSVRELHRQIEAFIERQKRMVIDGNHSLSQARWCGIRKCPGGWPLPGCPNASSAHSFHACLDDAGTLFFCNQPGQDIRKIRVCQQTGKSLCDSRSQRFGCGVHLVDKLLATIDHIQHIFQVVTAQKISLAAARKCLQLGGNEGHRAEEANAYPLRNLHGPGGLDCVGVPGIGEPEYLIIHRHEVKQQTGFAMPPTANHITADIARKATSAVM